MQVNFFSYWASNQPDQNAITLDVDGPTYTYGDIADRGRSIAAWISSNYDIQYRDRVCIIAHNCIEYIQLLAAAQEIGFILVPLNNRLTSKEIKHLIDDATPSLIICQQAFLDKHSSVLSEKETIPLTRLSETSISTRSYNGPSIELKSQDIALILYTSGSTGIPKGVKYTYGMMFWNSINTTISLGINSNTKALVCMPLFHTGGWNVFLTPILHHGGHCILTQQFDAGGVLSILSEKGCNHYMGVPTMLKMLSEHESFETADLSRLEYIIVGGEAMPLGLIQLYHRKGIAIRQGFGMSEVGPNLTSLHQDDAIRKIGSIGKPNMYVEVSLMDQENNEVATGQRGELCLKGPVVTPGYWHNPNATREAFNDGWFRSGDIAIQDTEGYLYIVDRIKNMFISGGENVYPAEVERVILKHEAVEQAIVIGVAHPKWGEVGKAFICCNRMVDEEEIINHCLTSLSKFKVPKHIQFCDEFPLNSTGKIDRIALLKKDDLDKNHNHT